jgi:hypothetical protein
MKKSLTILFLIAGLMSKAQTWAPIGATWYYDYGFPTGSFGTPGTSYSVFEVVDDTLINGITCSKIQKSKSYSISGRPMQEYTYYLNDSVFFYNAHFSEFQLLYDFDAVAGEFWYYRFYGDASLVDFDSIKTVVDSTDFITINSIPLKRLYVHYEPVGFEYGWMYDDDPMTGQSEIIEYVGDIKNLISTFVLDGILLDYHQPYGLRCYDDSNIGHYETGIVDSCNYVNLLGETELETEHVSLYPNPANNKIFLNIETEFYQIYSSDGRLIQAGEAGTDYSIDVSNLQNGIYLLTLDKGLHPLCFVKE